MGYISPVKTYIAGEVLYASDLNADNANALNRQIPEPLSIAQGDILYRGASEWERLAKGTANYKLFQNAGATAPEWALGVKVGSFTRAMDAATGDVSTTGVGFKPSALIVVAHAEISGVGHTFCTGFADGSTSGYVEWYMTATSWTGSNSTNLILMVESTGKTQTAALKTFDADGFTLTWTRTGATASNTATVKYIAFR